MSTVDLYKDMLQSSVDVINRSLPPHLELAELAQLQVDFAVGSLSVLNDRARQLRNSGKQPPPQFGWPPKLAPSSFDEEEEEDGSESEEEEEEEEPPSSRKRPAGPRKKKPKPHADKPVRIERMRDHVSQMKYNYPLEHSLIVLSRDEYIATVERMRKNLDAIPLDSVWPELLALRNHAFVPPEGEYRCRLPKMSVKSTPLSLRGEETRCKGCDGEGEDFYVGNLACRRTKFHPACAAVIVRAVGRDRFFNCMGRMSRRLENGKPRPDVRNKKTGKVEQGVLKCHRDKWNSCPELWREIEEARAMFNKNTDR